MAIKQAEETQKGVADKLPKTFEQEEDSHYTQEDAIHGSKKALREEALAAKKEHKARMALAHAGSQEEAMRAQQ
jgi:hypothetical protein